MQTDPGTAARILDESLPGRTLPFWRRRSRSACTPC